MRDLATGTEQAALTGQTRTVFAVVVTPDGAHVLTGSNDRTVRVWDLVTGTELAVFDMPAPVHDLAVP